MRASTIAIGMTYEQAKGGQAVERPVRVVDGVLDGIRRVGVHAVPFLSGVRRTLVRGTIGVRCTLSRLMTKTEDRDPGTAEQRSLCCRPPSPSRTRPGSKRSACAGLAQGWASCRWRSYKHVANKEELLDGMVDIVFQ